MNGRANRISFYGVKIEVVKKTGDSCAEPRFRKVVYPGGWNKEITLPSGEMPPSIRQYHDFFQPLTAKLLGEDFADKAIQYYGHTGRLFPSQLNDGVGYSASLGGRTMPG